MIFFLLCVIDTQNFEPGCETVMFFHVSHNVASLHITDNLSCDHTNTTGILQHSAE